MGAVATVHPHHGPAVQAVYATGTVEPTVMMPIASRAMARLKELNVDEGAEVAKGQVLGSLEDEDLVNSLAQLQAQAKYAQQDFDRKNALGQKGYATKDSVDQSRAALDAANAAVAKAQAEIGFLKLTAPADGIIIKRDGEIGQLIPANQPVFWLSCCAPLRVAAEVDEEDIAQVKPGQDVLIRADAFPGKTFNGTVKEITPKGDPVARSYRVRISFAGDVPLRIGMTAETNIIVREVKDALLLPNSAITQDNKIWVVKNGALTQQPVTVGAKGESETEIRSGVTEGDEVVLNPGADIKAGQRVHTKLRQGG
jgi:RND family efflux transporter MFP subunit